jgi:hypothetical protein
MPPLLPLMPHYFTPRHAIFRLLFRHAFAADYAADTLRYAAFFDFFVRDVCLAPRTPFAAFDAIFVRFRHYCHCHIAEMTPAFRRHFTPLRWLSPFSTCRARCFRCCRAADAALRRFPPPTPAACLHATPRQRRRR